MLYYINNRFRNNLSMCVALRVDAYFGYYFDCKSFIRKKVRYDLS